MDLEKRFSALPSPPEFLVERQRKVLAGELLNDPIHHLDLIDSDQIDIAEKQLPENIDVSIYKLALQDRKAAEMNYAEIYSKYLEVMSFNEKLLKHLRHQEMYRFRVRQVYDRLKYGDDNVNRHVQELNRVIKRQQEEIGQLNTECKALKISLSSYEEAFNNVDNQLKEAKAAHELAERQFQILAEEYVQRGHLLSEAEDKIQAYVAQIERMNNALCDVQDFNQQLRDDNIVFKAKLQEANTGNPQSEFGTVLTHSVYRMQERINQLEAQTTAERQQAQSRITELEERLATIKATPPPQAAPTAPPVVTSAHLQSLYNRWDQVIGELSSLSKPVREDEKEELAMTCEPTLISESGEITSTP